MSKPRFLPPPVNAVLGFAQRMDSGSPPPTPAQKDSIDQILQAGWHLLEPINGILDLARIESGKLSLSQEPMSLAEVLADGQAMIEPQARKSGISGVTALKILAGDPASAHIPVLALSANAMPRDIEKGLEAGFFRYLTKPIKVNEFMAALDLALEAVRALSHRATNEATSP